MNAVSETTAPAVCQIPLDRLSLAPENVRTTAPDAQASAEIKASIAAHGLLENLVVREDGNDGASYAVIAGGRRLQALQALAEDGTVEADTPVPCQVLPAGVDFAEISLAENVVRIAMHPADQVTAFTKLAEAGQTVATIAARFGATERTVEQRLRLGGVAPALLDAYRAGDIDLETLTAFAVTTDRERQTAVWEQVSAQGHAPSPWQVKRLLTEERVPGTAALARFVGAEAYEAAGGVVMRDLFADDDARGTWFEDPALLETLAMDRLQATADELAARWKWTAAMTEVSWDDTSRYARVYPVQAEPTDDELAEIARMEARQSELADVADEDWTDKLEAEAVALDRRMDELNDAVEARAQFSDEDLAIAGCIVTVARDGGLELVEGLVKPEDVPETGPAGDGDGADGVSRIREPAVAARPDSEAEVRKKVGVGIGLADDLRSIRTALVKAHLAGSFAAAFDLALFQMARSVLRFGFVGTALDVIVRESADRPHTRLNDAEFADWSPGEAMLEDRSGLALDWMEIEDDGESFAALRALPDKEKRALFAACVARTVRPQLAFEPQARPELEATVARLGIDFAAHVRPTAGMFWSRIPKGRMLEIARQTLGVEWADARSKLKKPELAEAMEAAFAAGDTPVSLSKKSHAAALAWTPPGFEAFDAGSVTVPPVEDGADASDPDGDGETGIRDVAPDLPEELAATLDVVNSVPTADGSPRVIVAHVGPASGSAPADGDGEDAASEEADVPEFLRQVH